ncbi:MAG: hypothetical protein RLZZ301_1792 [Bacteroidota bacterium]|jgi:polyisoprenoid-binding protein YceI
MKKKALLFLGSGLLVVASAFTYVVYDHYVVTDDFSIDFKSKDPSGSFTKMDGTIEFDEKDLGASSFNLKIDISSISTGNGMMNKKSQTEEWFNATKYPYAKFKSTKIDKKDSGYTITGDLTIKGITKLVAIPATLTKSGSKISFKGTFNVNRMDFKVGHKSDQVPDIMKVSFNVPAITK